MNLLSHTEDIQYFKEVANTVPKKKAKYCERTIKLLEEAHEIAVTKKVKSNG